MIVCLCWDLNPDLPIWIECVTTSSQNQDDSLGLDGRLRSFVSGSIRPSRHSKLGLQPLHAVSMLMCVTRSELLWGSEKSRHRINPNEEA